MRGRTISIYIPDANPRSIKICDIKDSIVKAIFIPRSKLTEANTRPELANQGIYFLVGERNEVGKPTVYIGEAEELWTRINQQNSKKEFWNAVICFVSEKQNLNKGHIKYLENYAYLEAKKINKCDLKNDTIPTPASLTEQEEAFVLGFFDDLKLLIATLGYPIFEETKKDPSNIFVCKGKDADAIGEYTEDGFVVFKDSKSNLKEPNTSDSWTINTRKNLIDKGILKRIDSVFVFTEDYVFSSPSTAATVILARRANGWSEWKDKSGKTLNEKIRKNLS